MVISEVIPDIYILYLALISQLEEELSNSSINLTNDYKGSLHISPPSFLLCECWGNLNDIFFILLDYNGWVVQCVNVWEQLGWLALVIWCQTLLWSELRTLFVSPPAPSVCITFSPHSHKGEEGGGITILLEEETKTNNRILYYILYI